jgi:hypothetical protein
MKGRINPPHVGGYVRVSAGKSYQHVGMLDIESCWKNPGHHDDSEHSAVWLDEVRDRSIREELLV